MRGSEKGGGGGSRRIDSGLLILRCVLGLIVLIYGCQKMLGIFGGAGFAATVSGFDHGMGIPPVMSMLSIAAEFFGSLGVIAGLLTPIAAAGLTVNFAVATFMMAKGPGAIGEVFSSGDSNKMSHLFYPLLLCFVSLAVLILGPGNYSLDAKLFRRK